MAAFQKAVQIGVDIIELDVQPTADDEVVVFHDDHLHRVTSETGMVIDKSLEEMQGLKAGEWFNDKKFHNETIPSLDETVDYLKDKCEILVEIKSGRKRISTKFLRNIFRLIHAHDAKSVTILQSFDTHILNRIHNLDPSFRMQKLIVLKIPLLGVQLDKRVMLENVLKKDHYEAINVDQRFVSPNLISKIHRNNKQIYCWTVNEKEKMQRLIDLGVDGIITNYPNVLQKLLHPE